MLANVLTDMTAYNLRFVIAALLVTASLWLVYTLKGATEIDILSPEPDTKIVNGNADQALSHWDLKPHGLRDLSPTAEISTLYLQAVSSSTRDFDLIEEIDTELPPFAHLEEQDNGQASPFEVRSLNIPSIPPRADASSVIFGVATTLDRLEDSLEAFAYWAAGTGTTIVALVSPPDASSQSNTPTSSQLQKKAHSLDLNLVIHESPHDYITRYITLLSLLHDQATSTPSTTWASIIDDDTFFPSTTRLTHMLNNYNASQPQYIGGLTEDLAAIEEWGYLAYGGAGIFLSVPLLTQLQPHLETCLNFNIVSGDGKLGECIYRYTTTKLSVERGLNQLDLFGDHTGFYEAVRPLPVSVHHWKSSGRYDMLRTSAVARITGADSILQKFHLRDDWWMTHGFSIVKYSDEDDEALDGSDGSSAITDSKYLTHRQGAMERTFTDPGRTTDRSFLHSLEPLRPKDEGKIQYLIESAVEENSNTMSLYYVKRVDGVGQSVFRVIWTRVGG